MYEYITLSYILYIQNHCCIFFELETRRKPDDLESHMEHTFLLKTSPTICLLDWTTDCH